MSAPKYFEVFGDAVAETLFLRNLAILLGGLSAMLTFALVRASNKEPLVIRVDRLREPVAISDAAHEAAVTASEVKNFADHFTRDLLAWDLYSLDDDIDRALAMMTPEAAAKMKRRLDGMDVTRRAKADSLRTKVVVSEIAVEKDTPHVVRIKVRGSRVAESYDKKELHRETIFEDTIVAKKVAREVSPWGLLVDEWSESIYKETETPK